MRIASKLLLVVLTLPIIAASTFAQEQPPGTRVRRPTPTPTPVVTPAPVKGRGIGDIRQGRGVSAAEGIFGAIRWKKEYGLPSTDGGLTPNKALNCTAFRVQATVQEGAPGTFGNSTSVGYSTIQNEPTEENGFYICRYSISNRNPLPHDRLMAVSAFLGPFASAALNQSLITGVWYGATGPPPSAGYQRVLIGGRGVTLTANVPRATVDFEVVYRAIPAGPR